MTNNAQLLHDLVQVSRDSQSFYQDVAKDTSDNHLRGIFTRMATAKGELIHDLSGALVGMGEAPPESGTVAGSLRKAYAEVRAVFSKEDNKIYVGQLEETEDRVLEHFEEALAKTDSPEVRRVLSTHLPKVRACHDEMRNLKHAMHA